MQGEDIDRDQDWSRANLRPLFACAFDEFERFSRDVQRDDRFDDTFTDSWDRPQTYGAVIPHVIFHDDEHRQEILHVLQRIGVDNVPAIDHALCDFVRRGLFDAGEQP